MRRHLIPGTSAEASQRRPMDMGTGMNPAQMTPQELAHHGIPTEVALSAKWQAMVRDWRNRDTSAGESIWTTEGRLQALHDLGVARGLQMALAIIEAKGTP